MNFIERIKNSPSLNIQSVVPFNADTDILLGLDFTDKNEELTAAIIEDTAAFSLYINQQLQAANARYGIGGYNEHRTVYSRSKVFDAKPGEEPRRVHLGIDIWGAEGTRVFAPLDGVVHSFAFNNTYGDYGATIILEHQFPELHFFSLYGHLSLNDLNGLYEGKSIKAGELIAHFGGPEENGAWPPHLHFQLILSMDGLKGDYPGVCSITTREKYLQNCIDPDIVLSLLQYAHSTVD